VTAGGVTGTVETISLFGTTIVTPDNVVTIVGNNKIFSDVVQNFSANPYRRVDLTATINNAVDHRQAIRLLKERLSRIPNVLATPAPDVEILQFTPEGPQLCVRAQYTFSPSARNTAHVFSTSSFDGGSAPSSVYGMPRFFHLNRPIW